MLEGMSGAAACRSRRFFDRPRTFSFVGSASARSLTTVSRKGTRASRLWNIDIRSVFTSRSSAR
jgi:hypothetical protein